ncbi:CopM family metallochaperone [Kaistia dalseonensis]
MMNHGAMQNGMMNRGDMPMMDDDDDDASASTKAFRHADRTMMQDMMIDYTGNADVDFVRGMIPHHQGAIDMAKVELEYGKDPEIRKLAEGIIKAQTEEIALMNAWLAAHAK